ncbi:DUF3667 domain-containing protein [Paraflavitalea sp. CAU 1676]|uniref:DUF3667 domain-containing protein n=1 Tax=Paraflavitalea sp. CAU 1676 TaxID=3032598 RepID=UPI0023DA5C30|nr:DUF3667 domain-containing protein [Paraflavitalea sp. CAU 1676]MDF2191682.1 DUF3667 domain-containing protein [Paraflavitalea sp. CAU 1676]
MWGLVSHFFYDITHFDGKFFSTTKLLITKPGFLPAEYIKGRRASYLHPIRMYVFSSALFFLIFFSLFKPKKMINGSFMDDQPAKVIDSVKQLSQAQDFLLANVNNAEDSAVIMGKFGNIANRIKAEKAREDSIAKAEEDSLANFIDSVSDGHTNMKKWNKKKNKARKNISWDEASSHYKTVAAYDSAQAALPEAERDGWWSRLAAKRNIELAGRYKDDERAFWTDIIDAFMHTFPYMLFISLPLYAFFMKLLYFRHKQIYYVEHGIFFIYLYIFTFIFLLLYFSVMELRLKTHQGWIGWFEALLLLGGTYYAYKAMRKFYGQSRGMTILKFFLLNVMAFFALLILFIFFFTITVVKM